MKRLQGPADPRIGQTREQAGPGGVQAFRLASQRFHQDHLQQAVEQQRSARKVRRRLVAQQLENEAQASGGHIGGADMHEGRQKGRQQIRARGRE